MTTTLRRIMTAVVAAGTLLAGTTVADPAQEEFGTAPTGSQQSAREAVAIPRLEAGDLASNSLQGQMGARRISPPLPDFRGYRSVPKKKAHFFAYLLPLVESENARIGAVRRRLLNIYDHVRWHRQVKDFDLAWLQEVCREYGLADFAVGDVASWVELLTRVDTLPVDLVLVQAANESGWGTSRFAREGNNLFGQWCFREGCGMIPAQRPAGSTYEVARYDTVAESIASYMHNLNTGRSYADLREVRARARAQGVSPSPRRLAQGLTAYSQRGADYVVEIQAMMRHNARFIAEAAGVGVSSDEEG